MGLLRSCLFVLHLLMIQGCRAFFMALPALTTTGTRASSSRRSVHPLFAAVAPHPHISLEGVDLGELSAGDVLHLIYKPRMPAMREDRLAVLVGYNGWDGEEKPALVAPMLPNVEGAYAAHVHIPNFARTVDYLFSDGMNYDTNDGELYHIRVRHVQEAGPDGSIVFFRQEDDGQLVQTGTLQQEDPQELERMIEEELKARKAAEKMQQQQQQQQQVSEGPRQADITYKRDDIAKLSADQEMQLHETRAKSKELADRLGISVSILPSLREAFEAFSRDARLMPVADLRKALSRLGLDIDREEAAELVGSFCNGDNVTVENFMHIYAELDARDAGVTIL